MPKPAGDFLTWSERDAIRKIVFARGPHICVWCLKPVGDYRSDNPFTIDHIIPRCEGGSLNPENLVLSCKPCNAARADKSVTVFMAARGTA